MKFATFTLALAISGLAIFSAQSAFAKTPVATNAVPPETQAANDDAESAGIKTDLQKLRDQHAADLDRAAYDLNVRYTGQLGALLIKATQVKDYRDVNAINTTLQETSHAISHSELVKKALRDYLLAHDWTLVDLFAPGHPRFHFWFKSNGNGLKSDGSPWVDSSGGFDHWAVVSGNEFLIANSKGNFALYFRVDRKTNTVTLDKEKSAKDHLDKAILFGNQTTPAEAIQPPTKADAAQTLLRKYLTANDWTWVDLSANGHPRLRFQFNADGTVKHIKGWAETPSSWGFNQWETLSGNEFRIWNAKYSLYFKVDQAANTVTLDKEKTSGNHQDKEILFGDQTSPTNQSSPPNSKPQKAASPVGG